MVATVTVGLLHHKALPCKWKTHDEHAPEYGMIDGPVCPACLQFLWSSHRVRLHLMYMPRDGSPNQCYQYLQSIGFTTTPACVPLPSHLRGAVRLDALCAAGPLNHRPHCLDSALLEVHRQIEACEADLVSGPRPENAVDEGTRLGAALTRCTRMWCSHCC
jgi:hypothetical protein